MEGSPGSMKKSKKVRMRLLEKVVRQAYLPVSAILLALVFSLPLGAQTFAVGNDPGYVLFDGTNIWVSNRGDNTVMKLRPSDGVTLGTFPVGSTPVGMAFDGANIWTANRDSNTVTVLRAADGVLLATYPVGAYPHEVAYDGANIWVTDGHGKSVTKLRATDGVIL